MPIGTDKPSPKRIGKLGTGCEWHKHLDPWSSRNANKRTRKAMKSEIVSAMTEALNDEVTTYLVQPKP